MPPGSRQTALSLDAEVAYHRAFEAVLWAMPASTHRLHVPGDMPAKQFWSLTVYNRACSFRDNPLNRPGLGSFNNDRMKMSTDWSIYLYFGPAAPSRLDSKWIPTMDKEPCLWLRLYGPEEALWNKTSKMPDVETVGE